MLHDCHSDGFVLSTGINLPNETILDTNEHEMQSEDISRMPAWKDKTASAKCAANTGKDEACEILKNEAHHTQQSIKCVFGKDKPTNNDILKHYFSLDSPMHMLFKNELNEFKDCAMFLNFVATFLFLAQNDSSSSALLKNVGNNKTFSVFSCRTLMNNGSVFL